MKQKLSTKHKIVEQAQQAFNSQMNGGAVSGNTILDMLNRGLSSLNNSKFFAGVVMLMLNIGSKYITIKLSKSQEALLRNSIARIILIFAISWLGTRDVVTAFILTASFVAMTDFLFNENSNFCILPERWKQFEDVLDTNNDNTISDEEVQKAIRILEEAKKKEYKQQQLRMVNELDKVYPK